MQKMSLKSVFNKKKKLISKKFKFISKFLNSRTLLCFTFFWNLVSIKKRTCNKVIFEISKKFSLKITSLERI